MEDNVTFTSVSIITSPIFTR